MTNPGLMRNPLLWGGIFILILLSLLMRNPGGIGGTGIGGGDEGGIGGTGIWGTIDGFGSIHVNNYIIDYSPDQKVIFVDHTGTVEELRLGQVVLVETAFKEGKYQARKITVRHEVVGPLEAVDPVTQKITVLGQQVNISALEGEVPKIGTVLAVSGYFDGHGVIEATRLDKVSPHARYYVHSRIEAGMDQLHIGTLALKITPRTAPTRAVLYVTTGEGGWQLDQIQPLPDFPFDTAMRNLSISGYDRSKAGKLLLLGDVRFDYTVALKGAGKLMFHGEMDRQGKLSYTHFRTGGGNPEGSVIIEAPAIKKPLIPEVILDAVKPEEKEVLQKKERPMVPKEPVRQPVEIAPSRNVPRSETVEIVPERPATTEREQRPVVETPVRQQTVVPERVERPVVVKPVRPQRIEVRPTPQITRPQRIQRK